MKVESAGYHFMHEGNPFTIDRTGLSHHLILLMHSPVAISINGGESVTSNGACAVILDKSTPRYYTNLNGIPLVNDFIQYSCNHKIDYSRYGLTVDTVYQNISAEYIKLLSKLISNIVQEMREERYNSKRITNLYFQTFFNVLGQAVNSEPKYVVDHPLFYDMYRAKNNLLRNFQNNPNVADIAKSIGLSEYYFRRVYKEIFNSTPQSDIINAKIKYARWMLENTDDSINTIANECGYTCSEHFMRQFKQITGVTPTNYRNNHYLRIHQNSSDKK